MPHKSTLLQFKYDNQIMGKSHHKQSNNPHESLSLQLLETNQSGKQSTNLGIASDHRILNSTSANPVL